MLGTSVSAAPLSGDYTVSLNDELAVFDTSGTYEESMEGITMKYTVSSDASGKMVGTGRFSADVWEMGIRIKMDGTINVAGTVKSAGEVTRLTMAFALDGSLTASGGGYSFSGNVNAAIKGKLEVDDTTGTLSGTMSGSLKMVVTVDGKTVKETQRIPKSSFSVDLPDTADGEWTITLSNVATDGKTITGECVATLGDDNSFDFAIKGSYKAKTDVSKITLTCLNSKAKITIVCNDQNAELVYQKVTGKAMGQKLKYKAPKSQ